MVRKLPRVIESTGGIGGTLMLQLRETPLGERYELVVGGHYVMAATDGPTERLLSKKALDALSKPSGIRLLIGGLGLGLTLSETLKDSRVEEVLVSEIEEVVIRWNWIHLREFNDNAIRDPRVSIHHGDVMDIVKKKRDYFDAVIMDVDNGPSFLVLEGNAGIYTEKGIKRMKRGLKTGGVLALWAYRPEPDIEELLINVFGDFAIETIKDPNIREDLPPTAIYVVRKGGK